MKLYCNCDGRCVYGPCGTFVYSPHELIGIQHDLEQLTKERDEARYWARKYKRELKNLKVTSELKIATERVENAFWERRFKQAIRTPKMDQYPPPSDEGESSTKEAKHDKAK